MKILIIDHTELFITRLTELIREYRNETIIYAEQDADAGLSLSISFQPELVFLELKLPTDQVIHLISNIKQANSDSRVFVLYTMIDDFLMEACTKAGADGCVDKYLISESIQNLLGEKPKG
jgi:DNA-binding NarL/FixJ family response regulator